MSSRLKFTTVRGEQVFETPMPPDIELRLAISKERDFLLSQTMLGNNTGLTVWEIFSLEDTHFIKILNNKKRP